MFVLFRPFAGWLTAVRAATPNLPRYDLAGLPLVDGYIELVKAGDRLAGAGGEHIDKIKLKAWRGPDYVTDTATDIAGVGWILAENWWPYQRSSILSPHLLLAMSRGIPPSRMPLPKILTLLTGDPFFPGGMGEFRIERNRFLVFEERSQCGCGAAMGYVPGRLGSEFSLPSLGWHPSTCR